jgi:hypothetical protein
VFVPGGVTQGGHGVLPRLVLDVGHDDRTSQVDDPLGDGQAQALGRSRDQDASALE